MVSLPQRRGGTSSLEACIKGRRGSKYSAPGYRFQSAAPKKVESVPLGEVGGGNAGPELGEHPAGCGGTELKDAGGGRRCGTPGLRAGAGDDPNPRKGRGEQQPVPMRGRGLQGAGGGRGRTPPGAAGPPRPQSPLRLPRPPSPSLARLENELFLLKAVVSESQFSGWRQGEERKGREGGGGLGGRVRGIPKQGMRAAGVCPQRRPL